MQGFKDLVAAVKRCQFLRYVRWERDGNVVDETLISVSGKWFLHILPRWWGRLFKCPKSHSLYPRSTSDSTPQKMEQIQDPWPKQVLRKNNSIFPIQTFAKSTIGRIPTSLYSVYTWIAILKHFMGIRYYTLNPLIRAHPIAFSIRHLHQCEFFDMTPVQEFGWSRARKNIYTKLYISAFPIHSLGLLGLCCRDHRSLSCNHLHLKLCICPVESTPNLGSQVRFPWFEIPLIFNDSESQSLWNSASTYLVLSFVKQPWKSPS